MRVLGIETSCDETAVALVEVDADRGVRIIGERIATQIELHRPWGGVVPEIATRQHLRHLEPLLRALWEVSGTGLAEVDGIGITRGPGLGPALLTGWSFGKALALATGKPWIGVNHLEGHLFSPFLMRGRLPVYPHLGLVVSGGHTLLLRVEGPGRHVVLGTTLDDAAGEAFDKVAKLLGLPYPGGPEIDRRAADGNPKAVDFPRSLPTAGDLRFSFSGLKTAVRVFLQKNAGRTDEAGWVADVCASFQAAVVDVLVSKLVQAARREGLKTVSVSGGVSCNSGLQAALQEAAGREEWDLWLTGRHLATDNAVMIAAVAADRLAAGERGEWTDDFDPNLRLESSAPGTAPPVPT